MKMVNPKMMELSGPAASRGSKMKMLDAASSKGYRGACWRYGSWFENSTSPFPANRCLAADI